MHAFTGGGALSHNARMFLREGHSVSEAANVVRSEVVSIEGMEDLLSGQGIPEAGLSDREVRPTDGKCLAQAYPGQSTGVQLKTIDEASKQLGLSPRTILRRLQKGTLPGCKVAGQFGLEWRVKLTQQEVSAVQAIEAVEVGPGQHNQTEQDKPGLTSRDQSDMLIGELRQRIRDLEDKLEGATYRNGYLESKLEQRDEKIKLLTDSQHKRSGWSRFWIWFTGGRGTTQK